jgi:DNA repair protein RecO (recombination protein O)
MPPAMPTATATGLIVRGTDWSETSRIVTLWTREFGKVRALAKGGRRPRSNFESALDLLTLCSIVLIRKTGGGLDLLTEARAQDRFLGLRRSLTGLYAGFYVAELLGDLTQEDDPHPALFDEAVSTLSDLSAGTPPRMLRLLRFETVLLRELGYAPQLESCASCRGDLGPEGRWGFSPAAGGVVCGRCRVTPRGWQPLSRAAWLGLRQLTDDAAWREVPSATRGELRPIMDGLVAEHLGHRPRSGAYLRDDS